MSAAEHSLKEQLGHWVEHLDHVLPSQAPIRDFVHHNTLHGYQHLPFDQAMAMSRDELGIGGYWPLARFRAEFAAGRIDASDLDAVLDTAHAGIDSEIASGLSRRAIWRAALRFDCAPIDATRLRWELDECAALSRIPDAMAQESRRWRDGAEAGQLPSLWQQAQASTPPPPVTEADPSELWSMLTATLGVRGTLRELILQLSGEDILESVRADLLRHLAAHLDQGLASWHNPQRNEGFYAAWRRIAVLDPSWALTDQIEARKRISELPADPVAAIEAELTHLAIPLANWQGYLERLAMQLPGWSGMFLWRHHHPDYAGITVPVVMTDYLAVRLVLESIAANTVARRIWGVPATLTALASYFWVHPVELRLRLACHRGELPEALASQVQEMEAPGERAAESRAAWKALAAKAAAVGADPQQHAARVSWPLFRLALALGLDAPALGELGQNGATALLACAAELDLDRASYLWLQAYEHHYAEKIFTALSANLPRRITPEAPEAQLVLCMDDREEGYRRHIEETNPRLETLGGAAHFAVFQNWRGLGDTGVTPLCPVVPVVIVPSHAINEAPRVGHETAAAAWQQRLAQGRVARDRRLQQTRFGLLSAFVQSFLRAPGAFGDLLFRAFAPVRWGQRAQRDALPPTVIDPTAAAEHSARPATPDDPRPGFTDDEQGERIGNFLTSLGLTRNFAPLVVIMGHGSNSQNNPHLAAYDCGACSGRHSGPNARLFATMANRPAVRERLARRGIHVPEQTHFLGAEHNTADDSVTWYDPEDVPPMHAAGFASLQNDCRTASATHAVERCRRLMSAPLGMTPNSAWQHVIGRRNDFSQPRPELGHVTNASAFFGRRSMSRGAFFDRRAFLISYDPLRDADGAVLTRHLTINGPVGAGINLEYYFSTVSNERFGCGTKAMHNVVGGLGVMAGASSDLRTGLPRQMIEIHEPMRLLVVVEQTTEILTRVYQEQPAVQELVGNGWVILAAVDPEPDPSRPLIQRFDPARGWLPWTPRAGFSLPEVERSVDWFGGKREPLAPVLLRRPLELNPVRSEPGPVRPEPVEGQLRAPSMVRQAHHERKGGHGLPGSDDHEASL
jgi:uncharacterized protein YbcC (UPF0753/DUF2309 family)